MPNLCQATVVKSFMVELEAEFAEQMLPILEQQRADMQKKVAAIDAQMLKIKQALQSEAKGGVEHRPARPVVRAPGRTPFGKAKKGESRRLITEFLKSLGGNGATTKDVSEKTGTNYSTAYRIMNLLQDEKLVGLKDELWIWAD